MEKHHNFDNLPTTYDINSDFDIYNDITSDINNDPVIVDKDTDIEEKEVKGEKLKDWLDNIFTWGEQGASIYNSIKKGTDIYDQGDKYEIYPEDRINEKADKKLRNWLIGTGVLVVGIIVTLVVLKNANKKK